MSQLGDGQPPEPSRPGTHAKRWAILGAVLGRGTLLVGPSPRDPDSEALVLVPPGVRVPASPRRDSPVSTEGWRVALWRADRHGQCHIDVGRPDWDSAVSLAYVVGFVEYECPQHLSWVADRLERRLRNTCLAQMPDTDGHVFSFSARWRRDAEAILQEIDIALTPEAHQLAGAPDVIESWLSSIGAHCPRHPATYEPRLQPGWLRFLYSEMIRDALASSPGRPAE